jgi:hypothetical protein
MKSNRLKKSSWENAACTDVPECIRTSVCAKDPSGKEKHSGKNGQAVFISGPIPRIINIEKQNGGVRK